MKSFTKSFFKPTNLHKMPRGMRWEQQHEDGTSSWWVQVSKEIETPKWITIGKFFGKILGESIESDHFMDKLLSIYDDPSKSWGIRLY